MVVKVLCRHNLETIWTKSLKINTQNEVGCSVNKRFRYWHAHRPTASNGRTIFTDSCLSQRIRICNSKKVVRTSTMAINPEIRKQTGRRYYRQQSKQTDRNIRVTHPETGNNSAFHWKLSTFRALLLLNYGVPLNHTIIKKSVRSAPDHGWLNCYRLYSSINRHFWIPTYLYEAHLS